MSSENLSLMYVAKKYGSDEGKEPMKVTKYIAAVAYRYC